MAEEKKESSEKREKMKGKGSRKKAAAAIVIIALAGIVYLISSFAPQSAQYQMNFGNETRNFRANLVEAEKVPVYPDSESIRNVFLGSNVSNITVYYIEGRENGVYGSSAFEFTIKMGVIYKYYRGNEGYVFGEGDRENCLYFYRSDSSVCFNIQALKSAGDISSIKSSQSSPALVLLGPPFSGKTAVTISNSTVTAEGRSFDETDRKYTDLDLAVDKLLLELMKAQSA